MNNSLKQILNSAYSLLVFPVYLLVAANGKISGTENTYRAFAQRLSRASGKHGEFVRRAFYKFTLKKTGKDLVVSFGSLFTHRNTTIGDRIVIGQYTIIGRASIGSNVMIADHTSVLSGKYQHRYNEEGILLENDQEISSVTIGKSTWIGAGSVVMNNVGEGSIIGAGSVVVNEIGSFVIAAGSPAKEIKKRSKERDNGF
ncbi:MAG: acyltransferase [Candidatus Krumholzibacteriota bacterium]|nr:acyltransferase [Candidatus Krumholzibacteriota bacterium]